MKNIRIHFLSYLLLFMTTGILAQHQPYYWYKNTKVFLTVDSAQAIVIVNGATIELQTNELMASGMLESIEQLSNKLLKVKIRSGKRKEFKNSLKKADVKYEFKVMRQESGHWLIPTGEVIYEPKEGFSHEEILKKYKKYIDTYEVSKYNTALVKLKKKESVFELANQIRTDGKVLFSEPNFYTETILFNNDPLYPDQYYLNNTGQFGWLPGVDINAPEAWALSTGLHPVRVVVMDEGVEPHPDLGNRVLPGYTPPGRSETVGEPSAPGHAHGQAVAGIIGATSDNNLGISGIAPFCYLISVNLTGYQGLSVFDRAIAIDFTWDDLAADVINGSIGLPPQHSAVDMAFQRARNMGRNGKGTVMVFAVGNANSSVAYPASLPEIIAVGAADGNGNRWSFSNYGSALDIMAPTGNTGFTGDMRTIDREGIAGYNTNSSSNGGDYITNFGATSGAAPVVSGVVALILSVNPNLTVSQVENHLYGTAIPMNAILPSSLSGWGRVDAEAALNAVMPSISGPDEACWGGSTFTIDIPSGATATWTVSSSKLTILSGQGTNTVTIGTSNPFHKSSEWISVSVTGAYGTTNFPQKTVWTGTPLFLGYLTGPTSANQFDQVTYWANNPSGEGTIKWSLPNTGCNPGLGECWIVIGGGDGFDYLVAFVGKNSGYVEAFRENSCGQSAYARRYVNVTPSGGGGCGICPIAFVSPNPTIDEINIEFKSRETGIRLSGGVFEEEKQYTIHDHQGNKVFSRRSKAKNPRLNLNRLKKGNYILTIVHGQLGVDKHHIIIN